MNFLSLFIESQLQARSYAAEAMNLTKPVFSSLSSRGELPRLKAKQAQRTTYRTVEEGASYLVLKYPGRIWCLDCNVEAGKGDGIRQYFRCARG